MALRIYRGCLLILAFHAAVHSTDTTSLLIAFVAFLVGMLMVGFIPTQRGK